MWWCFPGVILMPNFVERWHSHDILETPMGNGASKVHLVLSGNSAADTGHRENLFSFVHTYHPGDFLIALGM